MRAHMAQAIRLLHREKSQAYRAAWKKRGEVMSVLANIARKVDRLSAGGQTRDESSIDTAVDLLVYAIKYQTFLADHDPAVASTLHLAGVPAPYSDGTAGFEALLDTALIDLATGDATSIDAAVAEVDRAFDVLEHDFDTTRPLAPPTQRAEHARVLVRAAVGLVKAIMVADPASASSFAVTWGSTDHEG